jgi:hypothetical protein
MVLKHQNVFLRFPVPVALTDPIVSVMYEKV